MLIVDSDNISWRAKMVFIYDFGKGSEVFFLKYLQNAGTVIPIRLAISSAKWDSKILVDVFVDDRVVL
jgi:hypothetical protein